MLKVCMCECPAAEPLVRGLLREAGVTNWMDAEIHKGKEHCLTVLERLSESLGHPLEMRALLDYIAKTSTYAVVVGYDKERVYWSDFSSNAPVERTEAKAIVETFA